MSNWKSNFYDLFFNKPNSHIKEARLLKNNNIPSSLYKLYRPNEHAFQNLFSNTVWMDNPCNFNDPHDSSIYLDFNSQLGKLTTFLLKDKPLIGKYLTNEELLEFKEINDIQSFSTKLVKILAKKSGINVELGKLVTVVKEVFEERSREMSKSFCDALKNGYKVACFTEDIYSTLMWTHYAENHKGFAVEYDFSSLSEADCRKNMLYPVYYSNEFKVIEDLFSNNEKLFLIGIEASIRKDSQWSYESEWRLINNLSAEEPPQNYNVPPIKNVYLGKNIDQKNKNEIIKFCDLKKIEHHQMHVYDNSYSMYSKQNIKPTHPPNPHPSP